MPQITPRIINPPFAFADLDTEFLTASGGSDNLSAGVNTEIIAFDLAPMAMGDLIIANFFMRGNADFLGAAYITATIADDTPGGPITTVFPPAGNGIIAQWVSSPQTRQSCVVLFRVNSSGTPRLQLVARSDGGDSILNDAQLGAFLLKST